VGSNKVSTGFLNSERGEEGVCVDGRRESSSSYNFVSPFFILINYLFFFFPSLGATPGDRCGYEIEDVRKSTKMDFRFVYLLFHHIKRLVAFQC
jgi:hypothetical protein